MQQWHIRIRNEDSDDQFVDMFPGIVSSDEARRIAMRIAKTLPTNCTISVLDRDLRDHGVFYGHIGVDLVPHTI